MPRFAPVTRTFLVRSDSYIVLPLGFSRRSLRSLSRFYMGDESEEGYFDKAGREIYRAFLEQKLSHCRVFSQADRAVVSLQGLKDFP